MTDDGRGMDVQKTLFRNARVFDGSSDRLHDRMDVLVAEGKIDEVSETELAAGDADVFDCAGRVLMPGMIDAHVHVYATSLNVQRIVAAPMSYTAHFAARFLKHILSCGFTTVRDVGGADYGLATALGEQLFDGPRLFYGGRVISQTGGHGDFRAAEHDPYLHCCGCHGAAHVDGFTAVVNGGDQVRAAVREELRRGASHIKIMASGGVLSPNDPLERCQFADDEIRAAVEEATRWGAYAVAHCHPSEAVTRCVKLGVRSIEHATLIDEEAARLLVEHEAFAVPTMATSEALMKDGPTLGLPPRSVAKLRALGERALGALAIMKAAGVQMGFGTDLLGPHYDRQGTEFEIRARVLTPLDILQSATIVNAKLLNQQGTLGCISAGAAADLLVVESNPLEDISILAKPHGGGIAAIMKGGHFVRR